jgi:hypothetical protein
MLVMRSLWMTRPVRIAVLALWYGLLLAAVGLALWVVWAVAGVPQ